MEIPGAVISILDSVSYAIVAIDTAGDVMYLNTPAKDFLHNRGREFSSCLGHPASHILPIATPIAMDAMKSDDFKNGTGRRVDKGIDLFFEITPLMIDDQLQGAVISLQRPERFEEVASDLAIYQRLFKQQQAVFESSSDGIWVTDGDGTILNVNKASLDLNGFRGEEVIGKTTWEICARGGVDQAVTLEVMKHQRQVSLIQHIKKTDRQILATGTPVFDDYGHLSLIVVNERDLTELNNLRRDLAIAKQGQESVRNELNNLLMVELAGSDIVAESKSMRQVLTSTLKLAQVDVSNILITGESGVGKGMLANFLHNNSPRRDKPFLTINCAALPESLFEAELFGYEEGAFTGARKGGRLGMLQLAQGGTLFLDEIGELPLSQQAKLLTCLDQGEFMPIGADRVETMRCTLVFATNKDLKTLVRKKTFREDLFYRLDAFNLYIPPLRNREEDLFELARTLLDTYNQEFEVNRYLSRSALDLLMEHPFQGNVRELRSLMRKAVVMSEEDDLSEYLHHSLDRLPKSTPADRTHTGTLPDAVARLEREMLLKAKAIHDNTRQMAELLGVNQSTVVRKLTKYGLKN